MTTSEHFWKTSTFYDLTFSSFDPHVTAGEEYVDLVSCYADLQPSTVQVLCMWLLLEWLGQYFHKLYMESI